MYRADKSGDREAYDKAKDDLQDARDDLQEHNASVIEQGDYHLRIKLNPRTLRDRYRQEIMGIDDLIRRLPKKLDQKHKGLRKYIQVLTNSIKSIYLTL